MDPVNIQMSGGPLIKANEELISSIEHLRTAIVKLDSTSATGLSKEMAKLKTNLVEVLGDTQNVLKRTNEAVKKSLEDASKDAKAAGKKAGKQMADALEEEVAKIRVTVPGVVLPGGVKASIGASGVGSASAILDARRRLIEAGARDTDLDRLEKQTASTIKAATQPGYLPAGPAWWDKIIADQESARAKLEQAYQKSVASLEKNTASAMKAATKPAYLPAGPAWWDKVISDQESARAKLEQAYQKSIAALEKQTASAMKAATKPAYLPAGPAWWDKVIADQDKASAAIAAAAAARQLKLAQRQVQVATANPAGPYSISEGARLGKEVGVEAEVVTKVTRAYDTSKKSASELAEEKRKLAERSREVHGAFRGIAGAADLLFLTYGAMLPLTAAFFASTAVKQAIANFKDLEYQLKFVQALSGEIGASFDDTAARLQRIAVSAGAGPVEAAKGLRVLAQSGLSTNEALGALPDILRTATVGELDFTNAANTMTGAVYAFNLRMSEIGKVGDIFAKAGALSNTSVQSISESMKQASTVAGEFRFSIEDTATALVALAKRNITGSAGGTAFRNLLSELAVPNGDARIVAKQLGINLFDPVKGTAEDFFGKFVPELRKKLEQFNPQSQAFILSKLANERGAKALSAILGLDDASLQEIRSQIGKAQGFTSQAFIELSDSVQGDLDRLKSALSSTLISAGGAGKGDIRTVLQELRQIVESEGFKTAVTNLVTLVGGLAKALVVLGEVAFNPWAQLTALGVAFGVLQAAAPAAAGSVAAAGAAAATTATAFGALRTAAVALGRAFAIFAVVDGVVTALSMLYNKFNETSPADTAHKAAEELRKKYQEVNDSLREQIRLQKLARGESVGAPKSLQDLLDAQEKARLAYEKAAGKKATLPAVEEKYRRDEAERLKEFERARSDVTGVLRDSATSQALRDEVAKGGKDPDKGLGAGDKSFKITSPKGSLDGLRDATAAVANIEKAARLEAKKLDDENRVKEALLKGQYDRGLIKYDEYESQLDKLQGAHVANRRGVLEREITALSAEQDAMIAEAMRANANSHRKDGSPEVTEKALQEKLKSVNLRKEQATAELEKLEQDKQILDDKNLTRLVSATKAASDSARLKVEAIKDEVKLLQEQSVEQQKLIGLDDRSKAVLEAKLLAQKAFSKEQEHLSKLVEDLEKSAGGNPALKAELEVYRAQLEALRKAGAGSVDEKARLAGVNFDRAQLASSTKTISDAIADGIMDGTSKGVDSMKRIIQQELLNKPFRAFLSQLFNPFSQTLASAGQDLGKSLLAGISGFRAGGGPVIAGNSYIAGENGRELVTFGQSGRVYSAGETSNMLAGSGQQGQSVAITLAPSINIDSRTDRAEVMQLVGQAMDTTKRDLTEQLREIGVIQ